MYKIKCDVTKCSHNKERICHANVVNVGGEGAEKDTDTCCASFLDSATYSKLTNNINQRDHECTAITCTAETCTYNSNKLCTAESIHVSGEDANLYSETECSTFKTK